MFMRCISKAVGRCAVVGSSHSVSRSLLLLHRTAKTSLAAIPQSATLGLCIQPCQQLQVFTRRIHSSLSPSLSLAKTPSPYLHPQSGPLQPQPLDLDQPYPPPPEDNFYTISFYSFFDIPTEKTTRLREQLQTEWSRDLQIVGRIYICEQGINAQLSIPVENTQKLRQWLEAHPVYAGRIPRFNWAIEHRQAFKALHVRVRPLVATGSEFTLQDLNHEPEYLGPEQWETELQHSSEDKQPLLIDMRNSYEFRIGKFFGAVCPDVDTFREEMNVVREMCKDRDKKEPIFMYCTGGIRCSVAGAILKSEGYENVKTLQGGVIAYGNHIRRHPEKAKSSLFRGKNFTFDKRLGEEVTSEIISRCDQCGGPCDTFTNCANRSCNLLFIQCPSCAEKHKHTCGTDFCKERAQMSHEELIKNRMPSIWNYHLRVRPEKIFSKDGIAQIPSELEMKQ
ncbi:hypothetical protein J3B02_005340 [Coemansia erecta]|nr:hypothetical protein J3B02_005340 [Coemansia erecta]